MGFMNLIKSECNDIGRKQLRKVRNRVGNVIGGSAESQSVSLESVGKWRSKKDLFWGWNMLQKESIHPYLAELGKTCQNRIGSA